MATFKLWEMMEMIKIQVNFVEKLLFGPRNIAAKTLLSNVELSMDEKAYFEDFLKYYGEFEVQAYDVREILYEKM